MAGALALIEQGSPGATPVVSVRGEIDVGSTPALRDWLTRASEGGRCSIVVDLRGVRFLAVSGLYVLCDEQHRMAAHGARLTVVCTDPRALQLFAVCRLDGALEVVPTPAAARDGAWEAADEERADQLAAWMERYSAESASG